MYFLDFYRGDFSKNDFNTLYENDFFKFGLKEFLKDFLTFTQRVKVKKVVFLQSVQNIFRQIPTIEMKEIYHFHFSFNMET